MSYCIDAWWYCSNKKYFRSEISWLFYQAPVVFLNSLENNQGLWYSAPKIFDTDGPVLSYNQQPVKSTNDEQVLVKQKWDIQLGQQYGSKAASKVNYHMLHENKEKTPNWAFLRGM